MEAIFQAANGMKGGKNSKGILFYDDEERHSTELLNQTTCEFGMPRGQFGVLVGNGYFTCDVIN